MAALEVVRKVKESLSKPAISGSMHEVEFSFSAPNARKVFIAGKFNNWSTSATPMKKDRDGTWRVKVKLSPGRHEFKYFVDGAWAQNIPGADLVPNSFGTYNGVIGVE